MSIMKQKRLIKHATIVNEGEQFVGSVLIHGDRIEKVFRGLEEPTVTDVTEVINAKGLLLIPGAIDDQVHFRDPGLTHKGDIYTESKAAVAGGVTSYMEMPNTNPQTITIERLEEKYAYAATKALANFSFYLGATNDNLDELRKVKATDTCGIKVFMGASTGNMLVDDKKTLEGIFSEIKLLIATHCEDEETIRNNKAKVVAEYGEEVPIELHPVIRDVEACYRSSKMAIDLAKKYKSRLHVLHLSTAKEMSLFDNSVPLKDKRITAEACIHHLMFDDSMYKTKGALIKWNPAVKSAKDKEAILKALLEDKIDVIATDHAPHLLEEKVGGALKATSGGPLVQHSVVCMMQMVKQQKISVEKVIEKMCHAPAILFRVKERGFIREGYFADLVLLSESQPWTVSKGNLLYKCGWSPLEGETFDYHVSKTFVNGNMVYNEGVFDESIKGCRLTFNV